MKRRAFLGGVAAATAAGITILRRSSPALATWGEWPLDKLDAVLPEPRRVKNVLELYMYGGINAFDGLYTVPGWGHGNDTFLNVFYDATVNRFEACGFSGELTEPFGDDETGTTVHLGPWTTPLRQRPDVLARTRIMVQRHEQFPHEGANPLALTGSRLGSPRMAGAGAAVQRYFSERDGGVRAAPYAYVLYPGSEFPTDNVRSASNVGLHPASAAPLGLNVDASSELVRLLARENLGASRHEFDAAVDHYLRAYEDRFRPHGIGATTRSATRSSYTFANYAKSRSPELQDVLAADLFEPIPRAECGDTADSIPAMQARTAARLLTRFDNQARYVQWIDAGFIPASSGGHDTHSRHVTYTARNATHTFACLTSIINAPGENDPTKLDLDDTMIVINTEFGRTPDRQDEGDGLNHWPHGYVTAMIGGPITNTERGIYGYITEHEGAAEKWITPAENRIMLLCALGIYPFSSQTFAVGDVRGGPRDELQAALRIKQEYFGIAK